jgi:hypothetical protein
VELIQLIPSPYDMDDSYAYVDGIHIRKMIRVSEESYQETSLRETLSDDGKFILPKTDKGKPVKLTAANLEKRTPVGMSFSWLRDHIFVFNNTAQQGYYDSFAEGPDLPLKTLPEFLAWLDKWCAETTEKDLSDVAAFAARPRVHQKYREGDFFRYRIDRRHWAYGRILFNYDRLRKEKVEFWDVFFGKPLVVAVYRIMTEEPLNDIEKLAGLPMLPSQLIMDNHCYYGEAEIIGNKPLTPEEEDYPIHYGRSKNAREEALYLQSGPLYRKMPFSECLFEQDFSHCGIGFSMDVRVPVLEACIREGSNRPYWEQPRLYSVQEDLRNPKLKTEREAVFKQFGLNAADYVRDESATGKENVPAPTDSPAKKSFFDIFKKK